MKKTIRGIRYPLKSSSGSAHETTAPNPSSSTALIVLLPLHVALLFTHRTLPFLIPQSISSLPSKMKPLWHLTVHDELYSLMHGSCNIPFNGGRISGQGLAAKVNARNCSIWNLELGLKSSSRLLVCRQLGSTYIGFYAHSRP